MHPIFCLGAGVSTQPRDMGCICWDVLARLRKSLIDKRTMREHVEPQLLETDVRKHAHTFWYLHPLTTPNSQALPWF